MVAERADDLEHWWQRLTEDQKRRLKRAVRAYPADPSIVPLLVSAGELLSLSWTSTSIADGPQAIAIHDPLKSFVESKIDDE